MTIHKDSPIAVDLIGKTELYYDNNLIFHKEGQVLNLEGVSPQDAKQLSSILKNTTAKSWPNNTISNGEVSSMTEKRIARITETDGVLFKGMAEGMEWTVVPSVFSQPIEAGDFILCHVLTDDDEIFHLEAIPHVPKQTQEEWMKQEQQYI